jgi:hypothetical protein
MGGSLAVLGTVSISTIGCTSMLMKAGISPAGDNTSDLVFLLVAFLHLLISNLGVISRKGLTYLSTLVEERLADVSAKRMAGSRTSDSASRGCLDLPTGWWEMCVKAERWRWRHSGYMLLGGRLGG